MSVKKGTSYIAGRAQVDATPVSGSNNAVSSGGVYTALQDKAPASLTASVAALDAALSAKANDNQVVHIAGYELVTGTKDFRYICMRSANDDYTSAPAEQQSHSIGVGDKNGAWMGGWESYHAVDGAIFKQISARQQNGDNYAVLRVGILPNGTQYTYCPGCDWDNSILTNVAVNRSSNGYLKLGNGLLLQWGINSAAGYNNTTTVNFPTAFVDTAYTIQCTAVDGNNNYSRTAYVMDAQTTYFKARGAQNGGTSETVAFRWFALGRWW